MATSSPLILASGSPWRRQLLERLGIAYRAISPEIDETPQPGEDAQTLVARLAETKAQAVFERHPQAVVIGSDQVAGLAGAIIGKPGSREQAVRQLKQQSGRSVVFHTGVCVCAPGRAPAVATVAVETVFRTLDNDAIERYVAAEDVTATAGSIKSEGLGITLVERITSDDPTALIGLPLITLRRMLADTGITLP